MSFAFRTIRQEWDEEETRRTLLELSLDNGDISIVTNGASPTTSFQLRGLDEAVAFLAHLNPDEALVEARDLDDESLQHLNDARDLLDRLLKRSGDTPIETIITRASDAGLSVKQARRLALLDA